MSHGQCGISFPAFFVLLHPVVDLVFKELAQEFHIGGLVGLGLHYGIFQAVRKGMQAQLFALVLNCFRSCHTLFI
jgi:hypothetical protein